MLLYCRRTTQLNTFKLEPPPNNREPPCLNHLSTPEPAHGGEEQRFVRLLAELRIEAVAGCAQIDRS